MVLVAIAACSLPRCVIHRQTSRQSLRFHQAGWSSPTSRPYCNAAGRSRVMHCTPDGVFRDRLGGDVYRLVHGVVDAVMLALILASNSLVIFAILRYNRKLRHSGSLRSSHRASVRLVLSLAVSDILVALSTFYFLLFEYSCTVFLRLGPNQVACLARFVPFMSAAGASCYCIVALAVDRYVAVVHSLRYREIMTTRMTNVFLVVTWICGIATGCCLLFWNNWSPSIPCEEFRVIPNYFVTTLCSILVASTFVLLTVLHCRIHREVLAVDSRKLSLGSVRHSNAVVKAKRHKMNTKSARVVYLAAGCILVLWTPITALVVIRGQGLRTPLIDLLYGMSFTLYNLTYFVNSFVYAWKNTTVKLAIFQVFGASTAKNAMQLSARSQKSLQGSVCSSSSITLA